MGEALSQAQAVAVERDALANLLVGGEADRPRSATCSPGCGNATKSG